MRKTNRPWLAYAIIAGLCWGVWGTLAKFISEDVSPYMNHILFTIGMLFTLPFVIRRCRRKQLNKKGTLWGFVAGFFAISGNIAIYYAFTSGGEASIVVPLTNLYPMVTIFIAFLFLKERLNVLNIAGLCMALPAIVLLSGYYSLLTDPAAFVKTVELENWFWFSLISFLCWGIFSASQKITTNNLSAEWAYVIFVVSSVLFSVGFLIAGKADLALSGKSAFLGSIAGMLNGLGVLASFAAYKAEGKASAVTTVAGALQPVFTIILAMAFLQEQFSTPEGIGIVLAIIGALLLSYEKSAKKIILN